MKFKDNMTRLFILFTLLVVGGLCFPGQKAFAATAVKVAAVEYYDENIVVFNNGNTKIYYATDTDAANDNWDYVTADTTPNSTFTAIDFSWIMPSSETVILIKGDLDKTISRVVIKAKPSKLNVSIDYTSMASLGPGASIASLLNIMSTSGTSDKPITYRDLEWKKGDNGTWRSVSTYIGSLEVPILTESTIEKLLVKGAYLYFRIRAVDDSVTVNGVDQVNLDRMNGTDGGIRVYSANFGTVYPDGTKGRRFSDEVKLKIAKKSSTSVSGVDGSKFTAPIKYGKEYKVTVNYTPTLQETTGWISVLDKSVKKMSLADLVNAVNKPTGYNIIYNGTTDAFPEMEIAIRDYATSRTVSSKESVISLDAQRKLTKSIQKGQPLATGTYTKDDIFVYYFGDKYILLTIPMATSDLQYEYCIKPDSTFDVSTAIWTSVTRNTPVKLLASKAVEGGTIYVRQKEIRTRDSVSNTVSYQLASTYVTHKIKYPSTPVVTAANITYTKGYSNAPAITVTLNAAGKEPFETSIKSIKLGVKEIAFTPTLNTPLITNADGSIDGSSVYTLTATLKKADLEALAACQNRILTIYFTNGIVDKTSIKMTIKSPTASGTLTLSAIAGTNTGTTKVSVISSLGVNNTWVYVTGPTAASGINTDDKLPIGTGNAFTSPMDNISIVANQYITVYEIDANRNIIKYKSMQITSGLIKSSV